MKIKKVNLIGFAPTTRGETPWLDPDAEFWGCNEGYVQEFPVISRWFQIHPFVSFSRENNPNDPKHFEWLKKEHPFEIYMQKHYEFIPNSVQYPLEAYITWFGREYFRSSFDYMMAMAIAEEYTDVGIYGFEMASETEYAFQRPSAEYWIGRAEGMGVRVTMAKNSNLLRGSLYGFGDNSVGLRQQLEMRAQVLKNQLIKERSAFDCLNGATSELAEIQKFAVTTPTEPMDIGKRFAERQEEMIRQNNLLQLCQGAKLEVDNMIRIFDGHSGNNVVKITEEKDGTEADTQEK